MSNPYPTCSLLSFIKVILRDRGFHYIFWLRLCSINFVVLRLLAKLVHRLLSTIYGIQIPAKARIGEGLRLNHGFGVVFNDTVVIGRNVIFHQMTTIGSWKGQAAIIGNNVCVGPGVNIVDNVSIGNNSIIGAGSVVVKDIPENAIVAGNPARIIKYKTL